MAHKDSDIDLDTLLHPARAFAHPRHVVVDPDLTLNEKRSILASWASDARAVDSEPALRNIGGTRVQFDDVIDALRELDRQAQTPSIPYRNYRRVLERQRGNRRLRRSSGGSHHDSGAPAQ